MAAEWTRAAETQLALHRWMTSSAGGRWMSNWLRAEIESTPKKAATVGLLANAEPMKLLTADPIWVSEEMCDIVDAARQDFQPEPLLWDDFIVPTGFLYFARPLIMDDRRGTKVSVGAISWCPANFPSKPGEPDAAEGDDWGMAFGMFSSSRAPEDAFHADHLEMIAKAGACELVPLHFVPVRFGDELGEAGDFDDDQEYAAANEWWRTIQATLRLMQQRVAVSTETPLPRPDRRRAERAGFAQTDVLVITLRRPSGHGSEPHESSVDWTHRWIVGGHWRNQWYPATKTHRQIWISPYVKGPEDAPLVVKKRYMKWER